MATTRFGQQLSFFATLRKQRDAELSAQTKLYASRDKYLGDAKSVSRDVADMMGGMLPETAKVKKTQFGGTAPHAAVDEAFHSDHPFKGLAQEVVDISSRLKNRNVAGQMSGEELTQEVFKDSLIRRLGEGYKYNLKQKTSVFGKDIGFIPGFEEYEKDFEAGEGKRDYSAYVKGLTPSGVTHNLAVLTAGNIALQGVGLVSKKVSWRLGTKALGRGLFALPPVGIPGVAAKVAGLALMGAAEFAMFDAASEVVGQSKWAKAREDEPIKVGAAELIAGGAVTGMAVPKFAKAYRQIQKGIKNQAVEKAYNKSAAEILENTQTVESLLEYNKSLKRLRKSTTTSAKEIDDFVQFNKSAVEELRYQAYNPSIASAARKRTPQVEPEEFKVFNEAYRQYSPTPPGTPYTRKQIGVTPKSGLITDTLSQRASVADDVIYGKAPRPNKLISYTTPEAERNIIQLPVHTPELQKILPFTRPHLTLPKPIENQFGRGMNHEQRVTLSSFYGRNTTARNAVISMRDDASPQNISMVSSYIAQLPKNILDSKEGVKKVYNYLYAIDDVAAESFLKLSRTSAVQIESASSRALTYAEELLPYKQQFKKLGPSGLDDLANGISLGIKPEISMTSAVLKTAAIDARSTVIKDTQRNTALLVGLNKDWNEAKQIAYKMMTGKQTGSGLTPTEVNKIVSQKAEVTVTPKTIDTKSALADVLNSGAFVGKPATLTAVEKQIKLVGGMNGGIIPTSELNKIISSAEQGLDKFGKKILGGKKVTPSKPAELYEEEAFRDFMRDPESSHLLQLALVTVPMTSFGLVLAGGDEAHAGMWGKAAVLAGDVAKKATGKDIIKALNKSSMVGVKGDKKGIVERWQDGVTTGAKIEDLNTIHTKTPSLIRNFVMTPGAVAKHYYKEIKSPLVELASRMTAVHNNIQMHAQTVKEILSEVPKFENATRAVRKAMAPLVAKYEVPIAQVGYHQGMLGKLEKQLKKTNKAKDKGVALQLEKDIATEKQALFDAKNGMKGYEEEWTQTVQKLAAEHSSSRIALALEDTAEFEFYPWLKDMLSHSELAAVSRLKDLNKITEGRVVKAGGDVIKARPFAHHAIHPDSDMKAIHDALGRSTINAEEAMNLARLNSRSIGSKMMMPDVEYMFERYIPDVEKRMQIMQFWKKGKAGGWDAHVKDLRKHNMMSTELDEFWKGLNKSFEAQRSGKWAERARRYYSGEVLWRLFLSPSVGFKHLMKFTADLAIFPPSVVAKGVAKTFPIMYQNTLLTLKEQWPKQFGHIKLKPSDETQLVRAYINQGRYNNAIAELEIADTPLTAFDKTLDKFNRIGSIIVGTVENFDRTATVLMGMEMAAKKGMTPTQATHAVFDTILKANFLSGVHNPKWVRDPFARAFFMFQGTPFKLAEQRAIRALKAGKDITKAGGIALKELQQLKAHVKEGEYRVKYGLIMDALGATKDVYGQSVTKQFAVNVLTLGGLLSAGSHLFDADMHDQLLHLPFIKPEKHSLSVNLNPIVSAGYDTWASRHLEDRDLLFTEFWNNWSGTSGAVPASFRKAARLTKDDIPEIYKDSKWRYFFAIPGVEH